MWINLLAVNDTPTQIFQQLDAPFNRELAANSYNMYLAHYVFVMTLPLLLSTWVVVPVLIRFGVVALFTVFLTYVISRYVLRPFPGFVVIGLVGINILLAVVN